MLILGHIDMDWIRKGIRELCKNIRGKRKLK